jgi:hypothetical protein
MTTFGKTMTIWGLILIGAVLFMTGNTGGVGGSPLPLILLLSYFLPTIVAYWRGHRNLLAIFILNLLLGWTILGGIAALVWSCTSDLKSAETRNLIH